MKPKLLLMLMLLVGALALAAAGCGGDEEEAATEEPAAPEEVSFELRLGHITSFTGDLSDFGRPIDTAVQIAVDLANEAAQEAGVDATVNLVASEDDQTDATAGVEAATKLVQTDNATVIIGSLASAVTIPIAESVSIPNEVIQISPASTSPAISQLEDNGFVWRTPPSDALQGTVLARAVADEFGQDVTVNTGTRNDAYGTALTGAFEQAWKDAGGTIGQSVRWNPEAATFDSEAQQLTRGNPGAWMIIDFPETWAKVGPALVRAGNWDPAKTFTADGLRSGDLPGDVGGQATEGMRGTAPTSEGAPAGDAFDRVFKERAPSGVNRQTFDAQAFDAAIVAFLAAVAAGSTDPADIRDKLEEVTGPPGMQFTFENLADAITALADGEDIDYEGASGPIDFDENGDPGAALYEVWQFEGGKLQTLRSFPFEPEE